MYVVCDIIYDMFTTLPCCVPCVYSAVSEPWMMPRICR